MFGKTIVGNWFLAPAITGRPAHFWSLVAIVIPTLIRASVQGPVTGVPLLIYVPFVLLSAIALSWRHSVAVALVSALVGSTLFIEPRFIILAGPTDWFEISAFLIATAMIIKFVHELKGTIVAEPGSPAAKFRNGIVFSSEGGDAWASWHGQRCTVRLGTKDEVAEMMQDYLAQCALGKKLAS
ncbi:DUF4118 domain-containing protein [Sphingomonas sp. NSE70-1]|uniref:DUF4118 domain-containing protein n=1 Tax=Sphingomonas caseinilyticus TaxID=2908205 RepID=A0ABT0RRU5_9SPHN|nr:DUF4118 domain-containing protein [Sphingomonas caseinilyticus]MCL6697737.1 DUF4118 domain-containing protein [Sphingomonas caseinilyticus]